MARLAIRGHATRGKEVIDTLKMLGGKNIYNYDGKRNMWYILEDNTISTDFDLNKEKGFTLEEFLEKFPYKIGDKVSVYGYETKVHIEEMKWDGFKIQYLVFTDETEWYSAEELNKYNEPYKEETMEEKKINQMSIANCDLDEVEIVLGDKFELVNREGKYYAVKKQSKYPKTFIEVLDFWNPDRQIEDDYQRYYKKDIIGKFQKLLYARDAYWKIAGEQMGLGKPWEPNFEPNDEGEWQERYGIYIAENKIKKDYWGGGDVNIILTFPTEEMRDMFYENFKDLIESCKEFL
jgi:hypothetical protein